MLEFTLMELLSPKSGELEIALVCSSVDDFSFHGVEFLVTGFRCWVHVRAPKTAEPTLIEPLRPKAGILNILKIALQVP